MNQPIEMENVEERVIVQDVLYIIIPVRHVAHELISIARGMDSEGREWIYVQRWDSSEAEFKSLCLGRLIWWIEGLEWEMREDICQGILMMT